MEILTEAEWRQLDEDSKCIENGRRYVPRIQDGVATIVNIVLREELETRQTTPGRC